MNEEKFSTLEEKKADALEMAAKAHEKRKEKASYKSSCIISIHFYTFYRR